MPEASSSSQTSHDYSEFYVDGIEYMVSDVILANQNVRGKVLRNIL